jgi:hypothetical protein
MFVRNVGIQLQIHASLQPRRYRIVAFRVVTPCICKALPIFRRNATLQSSGVDPEPCTRLHGVTTHTTRPVLTFAAFSSPEHSKRSLVAAL